MFATPLPHAAAQDGTGQIVVVTDPVGAEVTVDGQAAGISPAVVAGLVPGAHVVVVRHADGRVEQRVIEVLPGRSVAIDFTLAAQSTIQAPPLASSSTAAALPIAPAPSSAVPLPASASTAGSSEVARASVTTIEGRVGLTPGERFAIGPSIGIGGVVEAVGVFGISGEYLLLGARAELWPGLAPVVISAGGGADIERGRSAILTLIAARIPNISAGLFVFRPVLGVATDVLVHDSAFGTVSISVAAHLEARFLFAVADPIALSVGLGARIGAFIPNNGRSGAEAAFGPILNVGLEVRP